jgi:hypothetical protein
MPWLFLIPVMNICSFDSSFIPWIFLSLFSAYPSILLHLFYYTISISSLRLNKERIEDGMFYVFKLTKKFSLLRVARSDVQFSPDSHKSVHLRRAAGMRADWREWRIGGRQVNTAVSYLHMPSDSTNPKRDNSKTVVEFHSLLLLAYPYSFSVT